ncbi:MAG: hypothetical protein AAB152_17635 [Candidatus Coatesbacteria bacterium]
MVKDSAAFLKFSERQRARRLTNLTPAERDRISRTLIRAMYRHGRPRVRHDTPRALAFYVGSGKPA